MRINKSKLGWIGLALVLPLVLSAASCQRRVSDNTIDNTNNSGIDDQINNTDDSQNGDNALDDLLPINGDQTPLPSGLPDPDIIQSQAVEETQQATEFIQLIQPDAVLTAIATKYKNSLSDISGLLTNYYIFTASSESGYYFLVNVPRNGLNKMVRFIMPVQDFNLDFDLLPVPFQWWQINYAKALQLAETQGGGAEFRANHKDFEVSTILARPVAQHLTWSITYKATDSSGDKLHIQVHANTGNVQIIPL